MDLDLVTAPTETQILALLSVADLKKNLRISYAQEDEIAKDSIRAAYEWLGGRNGWLNRTILTTQWKLKLPGWTRPVLDKVDGQIINRWVPTSTLEIPLPPLKSVESVKYYKAGVLTTLPTDQYGVSTGQLFGSVDLNHGLSWPTGLDIRAGAVEIAFTAGWGDAAAVLENAYNIRTAMKLLAGDLFRNREDTYAEPRLVAVNRKIVNGVTRFAGRYRIFNNYA